MVQRRFDDVRSNYDGLPMATAVAASAAFPILLTPLSFQDYAAGCKGSCAAPLDRRRDPLARSASGARVNVPTTAGPSLIRCLFRGGSHND